MRTQNFEKYIALFKTLFLIFTACLFINRLSFGQIVSDNDVRTVAERFITKFRLIDKQDYKINEITVINHPAKNETIAFSVSILPKGFLIISSDYRNQPVIAYSFNNNWNLHLLDNDQFSSFFINNLCIQEESLIELPDKIKKNNYNLWKTSANLEQLKKNSDSFQQWPEMESTPTGGWVETLWHQNSPFNDFCPIDPVTNRRCYAGCGATAMMQIINYHNFVGEIQFHEQDRFTSSYRSIKIDSDSSRCDFPSFKNVNQYLLQINDKYQNHQEMDLTDEEKAALAFACGISVKMMYSSSGSGTYIGRIENGFKNKFNYKCDVLEPDSKFFETLIENMKNGLPALFDIDQGPRNTWHYIVCDGYNTDGYFHLNFGWGEYQPDNIKDAWYALPDSMPALYKNLRYALVNISPSDVTSISDNNKMLSPLDFSLKQNYPNPFNPSTTIQFSMNKSEHVSLKIFNLAGQHVVTLVDEVRSAGEHQVKWLADGLPGGIYLARLQVGAISKTLKLVFQK